MRSPGPINTLAWAGRCENKDFRRCEKWSNFWLLPSRLSSRGQSCPFSHVSCLSCGSNQRSGSMCAHQHREEAGRRVKMAACGWEGWGLHSRLFFPPSNDSYEATNVQQSKSSNFHIFPTRVCDFGLTQWHPYTSWFTRCPGPRISSMTGILLRPVETRAFTRYFCPSYVVRGWCCCVSGVMFFRRPPRRGWKKARLLRQSWSPTRRARLGLAWPSLA